MLETKRLVLRRWEDSDAESLYEFAKDPDVGPAAGWPAHQNIEESRNVIKTVLSERETYAVCLKTDNRAIGSVGLKLNGHTDMTERDDECELGYWLGKPFWGQGIMPEALRAVMAFLFDEAEINRIAAYHDANNPKSGRVMQKAGMKYEGTHRQAGKNNLGICDMVCYAALKEDLK